MLHEDFSYFLQIAFEAEVGIGPIGNIGKQSIYSVTNYDMTCGTVALWQLVTKYQ